MMQRVHQFFRAIRARLYAEDIDYIKNYLPDEAQRLFFAMNVSDQYHALHVAYTAERIGAGQSLDLPFLIRCALLHDVGRRKGDMGIIGKVFAVLLHSACPEFSRSWAKKERDSLLDYLRYALYVYYCHPAIGADLLRQAGFLQEADLIRHHHEPAKAEDSLVLRILRQADEQN